MFAMGALNPQQRAAVDHDDRPLLVLAGAGTGKTATLAARVARLVADGAAPERVCLVTFSRRAAAEMLDRAGRWSGAERAGRVVGGTFHALAQSLLRHHGHLIGLDPGFSLLDAADATDLMGMVRHDLGVASSGRARFPKKETLSAICSQVANRAVPLSVVVADSFPWCAEHTDGMRSVFVAYTARKRAGQLCDFDDLLLLVRALGTSDVGRRLLSGLFDHVLVDEYQDVNALQVDLVDLLCPGGGGLTAVGDDAQAIYGFRSATTAAIAGFCDRYPGARLIALEHNYRSTPPILAVANQVMADEASQAVAVCESVLSHREDGVALHDQAVLFRASHHAAQLELALSRRQIPYVKYGGLRFLEAAHVKDLVALLRLLDNPWDELAWFRVLQLLEGVGPVGARRVMADLGVTGDPGPPDTPDPGAPTPLSRLLAAPPTVVPSARDELGDLRRALADCAETGDAESSVGVQVDRLRQWLGPVMARRYDAPEARDEDLARLAEQAAAAGRRDRFVADLTLDPPLVTGDLAGVPALDDDWLVLSTVHSAKGGEWDVVHVIHAADGMFPSDLATGAAESIAEERRLFYVAVTRARNALEINVPLRYHHHRQRLDDRHGYAQVSRFLSPAVRVLMDAEHAGAESGEPVRAPSDPTAVAAVDAFLADLWA